MQKRRWGGYKKGAAPAADAASGASAEAGGTPLHQQPQHKDTLRSQLAGLRHRAAVRANRRQPAWAAAAAGDASDAQPSEVSGSEQQHDGVTSSLEYDSSEMSDGCNMASGGRDTEGEG